MRYFATVFLAVLLGLILAGCTPETRADTDSESAPVFNNLRDEVQYLIDQNFSIGGVAVGVINGADEFHVFYGTKSAYNDEIPDENTVYEMGSITKTFTGIVLAQTIIDGTIQLDDEVEIYLPAERVTMPRYDGVPITFFDLATHTSGLATNFSDNYPLPEGTPPGDPFFLMTEEHIYDYLTNYAILFTRPGTTYEYSNFGYGFLGFVLGKIQNMSYEQLVKLRILDVLGMNRTSCTLSEDQLNNIAEGHNRYYAIVEPWGSNHDLNGAGGIKSTLKDMMVYLKANMGLQSTGLTASMELSQQVHFDNYIGFGWQKLWLSDDQEVTWFAGGAAGHHTFIGFNKTLDTGVVVLYNVRQNTVDPNAIGKRILVMARKY